MRRKPKWWALILAVVLLAGSGLMAFKFHGYGGRGFNKLDMFDGRGHMSERFEKSWDDKDWDNKNWGHHGKGHGMTYEMSEEDLAMTPDEYAKAVAVKMYGEDAQVEALEIAEDGVVAYQLLIEGKLLQVLLIDLENEKASFMFR